MKKSGRLGLKAFSDQLELQLKPLSAGQPAFKKEGERPRLMEAGQPCWKCGTPVVKQKSQKRPNRDYYYEFYLYRPKCQATYEVAEAKPMIEQPPSRFHL